MAKQPKGICPRCKSKITCLMCSDITHSTYTGDGVYTDVKCVDFEYYCPNCRKTLKLSEEEADQILAGKTLDIYK